MDLGMRTTSHYDSMPCMTVASLEMSDEPFFVAFASKAQIIIFFNVAFTFCFISNDSYYKVTNSLDNPFLAVSAFELTFALYLKQ